MGLAGHSTGGAPAWQLRIGETTGKRLVRHNNRCQSARMLAFLHARADRARRLGAGRTHLPLAEPGDDGSSCTAVPGRASLAGRRRSRRLGRRPSDSRRRRCGRAAAADVARAATPPGNSHNGCAPAGCSRRALPPGGLERKARMGRSGPGCEQSRCASLGLYQNRRKSVSRQRLAGPYIFTAPAARSQRA